MIFTQFLIGLGFSIVIWGVIKIISRRQLREDYEWDYLALIRAIRRYKVTERNFAVIENKFKAIDRYRCRDKERLDVLAREFYFKFKEW